MNKGSITHNDGNGGHRFTALGWSLFSLLAIPIITFFVMALLRFGALEAIAEVNSGTEIKVVKYIDSEIDNLDKVMSKHIVKSEDSLDKINGTMSRLVGTVDQMNTRINELTTFVYTNVE